MRASVVSTTGEFASACRTNDREWLCAPSSLLRKVAAKVAAKSELVSVRSGNRPRGLANPIPATAVTVALVIERRLHPIAKAHGAFTLNLIAQAICQRPADWVLNENHATRKARLKPVPNSRVCRQSSADLTRLWGPCPAVGGAVGDARRY
jgi:hypothetical protein